VTRDLKPRGDVALNVGAIRNGSFSHEHYSSSPSKTLGAALGFSFHSTGCVKRAKECWNESHSIDGSAPAAKTKEKRGGVNRHLTSHRPDEAHRCWPVDPLGPNLNCRGYFGAYVICQLKRLSRTNVFEFVKLYGEEQPGFSCRSAMAFVLLCL
jgi:hypothetical protein